MSLCDYLIFVCFVLAIILIGVLVLFVILLEMYIHAKQENNTLQFILKELK